MKRFTNWTRKMEINIMNLASDRKGSEMTETLAMIIAVILVAGIIIGIVSKAVPELGTLIIERIKGLFNL